MTEITSLELLGSGTSTGVPMPGCTCAICNSGDPKNQRLRTSALVTTKTGARLVIDTSTDFRTQALRARLARVDAVLYTHAHADHILGLDDLRAYNFVQHAPVPCYGDAHTLRELRHVFRYVFEPDYDYQGGALPQIELHELIPLEPREMFGCTVLPLPVMHGPLQILGYRFGSIGYVTDCKVLPPKSMAALEGVSTLVLDGLRREQHATHLTIAEAIQCGESLGVKRLILVHMSHAVDYQSVSATLPAGVELGFDGLIITPPSCQN